MLTAIKHNSNGTYSSGTYRSVYIVREARNTAPKVPRPQSGLKTRPFKFFWVPVLFQ